MTIDERRRRGAESSARYRAANPEYRARVAVKNLAAYHVLRDEMFAAYGARCECCGEGRRPFLALDHAFGGGTQDRQKGGQRGVLTRLKTAGWPKVGYRVLCHNCNAATIGGRMCPHQVAA